MASSVALLILGITLASFVLTEHQPEQCSNVLPGLDITNHGLNIYRLTLPTLNTDSLRNAIFQNTCEKKAFWEDPTDASHNYSLPDQFEVVIPRAYGTKTTIVNCIRDMEFPKLALVINVAMPYLIYFGGILGNIISFSLSHLLTMKEKSTIESTEYFSAYYAELRSPKRLLLTDKFRLSIEHLKGKSFEKYLAEFLTLNEQYGTHYVESGHFGAFRVMNTKIENKLLDTKTDIQVQNEAKAMFENVEVGGNFSADFAAKHSFLDHYSEFTMTQYGGGVASSTQTWPVNVTSNPHLCFTQLQPISNLVEDVSTRRNVERAINLLGRVLKVEQTSKCIADFQNQLEKNDAALKWNSIFILHESSSQQCYWDDVRHRILNYLKKDQTAIEQILNVKLPLEDDDVFLRYASKCDWISMLYKWHAGKLVKVFVPGSLLGCTKCC